jgi:DNA-binding NarL/FixJ family response regulator
MDSIRIFLVDDHSLFRAGLRSLLMTLPSVTVVGEAGNGRDAIPDIERLTPDIVLMDISMAELNGIDAIRRIAQTTPGTRTIIVSMHSTRQYVLRALEAGAAGYLLKEAAPDELEHAIRSVSEGQTYLSPRVSTFVVDELRQRMSGAAISAEARKLPLDELTVRQREVLQLIAEGSSTKEIAQKLDVSVKTVDVHRTQLMHRLDIHDIAGLVRYAVRVGLIDSQK